MAQTLRLFTFVNVAKFFVLAFGAMVASVVVEAHLDVMPTFLRPGYEKFWDDVTAYRLRGDGHKSIGQLYADYDPYFVHDLVVDFSVYPALIPSEKAALACWLDISLEGGDPPRINRQK